MLAGIIDSLRGSGFIVSHEKTSYITLSGNMVEEDRLIATSSNGLVKITISRIPGKPWYRMSILMLGKEAKESMATVFTRLGGSVDYEPGDRLLAVFKKVDYDSVEEIVNEVLG